MRAAYQIALLLAAAPALGAERVEVISPRPDAVSVTIYRDLFALITETRNVEIPEGPVTLSFDGVVETLLPASAVVTDTGRALEERNYDYDELSPNNLFAKSIGREVMLTRTLPGSGKVVQTPATILAANVNGITLRTADGTEALHCSGLPEQVTFEKIPGELRARPRLSVHLAAGAAGKRQVRVSYLAHGFAWKSDYVARLDDTGKRVDLHGWLTLQNLTNASFKEAQVQVVAGKLHLLPYPDRGTSLFGDTSEYGDEDTLRLVREEALANLVEESNTEDNELSLFAGCYPVGPQSDVDTIVAEALGRYPDANVAELDEVVVTGLRASQMAERESLADYHLYRVPWPTDLNARQTKQVAFLDKRAVKVERFYRQFLNAAGYYSDERFVTPTLVLGFENRKSAGLGEPLPEGVLRLFESGATGDLFSGEGSMRDTAVGVPAEIPLAGAIDLDLEIQVDDHGERNRADLEIAEVADAQIRIANAKGVPVTVEIRQPLEEYMSNAQVTRASHPMFRKFGDFAWRIRVPANSADTLTYRLRRPKIDESGQ